MPETPGPHDRRNFLIFVAEGAFFLGGSSFISAQTVLPALITRLGGGNIAVGALGVIIWIGLYLPQMFAARIIQTLPWKKPWAVWVGFAQRVVLLTIGILVWTLGGSHPVLALSFFLLLYTLNQVITGIASPGWFDLYVKLTPLQRRGRVTGLRNAFAGAGAFLCSFVLTWLLAEIAFPSNYGIAIVTASFFQMCSILAQTKLVEEYPSATAPRQPIRDYIETLRVIFRENAAYRRFLGASAFLILATMPLGFFTVYALRHFGAGEGAVGGFTLTVVAGQIMGAILTGYTADRKGNRLALIWAAGALMAASVWALLAPTLLLFSLVFLLFGANLGSEMMIRSNLAIEYSPTAQRSTYVGLMSTLLAPLSLAGLLGGWIGDLFGYEAIFALGALCSAAGIWILVKRVEDPRLRRKSEPLPVH